MQYKAVIATSLLIVMGVTSTVTTKTFAQDNIPQTETPTPITSETVSALPELSADQITETVVSPTVEVTEPVLATQVVPEVLQAGKYDDRNPKIIYSGTWKQRRVSKIYKSTETYSALPGSSFTFAFEGPRFRLYFSKSSGYGQVSVNIDGSDVATINQYAKRLYKNKSWVSPTLDPNVPHVVVVTFLTGRSTNLDGILVAAKPAPTATTAVLSAKAVSQVTPLTVGVYDDRDTKLVYTGSWLKHGISDLFLGTESYSNKVGSTVKATFKGSSVSLFFRKHTFFGDVTVTIDGVKVDTIHQYQAWESRNGLWTSAALDPNKTHTVVFTHKTGKYMSVDAIGVNGDPVDPTQAPTETTAPTQAPTSTSVPTSVPTEPVQPTQVPTEITQPTLVPTSTALPVTSTPEVLPTETATVIPTETLPVPTSSPTTAPTLPATGSFYVDSVAGSDSNAGTSSSAPYKSLTPLKSKTFAAGNVIYFKRGSKFTGGFVIDDSGSASNPITFTAYGSGNAPVFENPGSASNKTRGITINADYVVLDGLKVQNTQDAGVYIATGSDYVTVRNTEITNTGIGVTMRGVGDKVLNSNIHDLHMVVNTSGGDDDYGAVGFLVAGTDGEIAYNRITGCKAPSYDYGTDGGTVEFYGTISGFKIHHNYAANNQGFIEVGSGSTGSSKNNTVSYNVLYNNARPMGLHLGGGFGAVIENLRFENNTVVDTRSEATATGIIFLNGTPTATTLYMRNNIFYLTNYTKFANGSTFTHDHNTFFFNGKSTGLGFTLGTGESIVDPSFVSLSGADYRLNSGSPAIDKGIGLGYSTDYNGNKVPNGGAPDQGAFEK